MPRTKDYVEKLANNIEQKLNMTSDEIKEMDNSEFRSLLKNGYFSGKSYKGRQTEPTDKQMDVLNLHYGKPIRITKKPIYNTSKKYYHYKETKKGKRRYYPEYVRKNKAGRLIDTRTGKFVSTKKK